jgi:hypothetical protein
VIDPAMMATADGPMGPAPVEQPTSAIQALAEFLGMEAQRQATVEQVASAAMQMLMEMAAGGGDPMMATADGPMGPEPMMGMEEEDPMGGMPMEEEMPMGPGV